MEFNQKMIQKISYKNLFKTILLIFIVLILVILRNKFSKNGTSDGVSYEDTGLPVTFPKSQREIDGFTLGQHISAVKNVLGQPDQIINQNEGETDYVYQLDNKGAFLAFRVYKSESGLIGAIQLTGDYSDKKTFLGLKLGDSKEKVIKTLGNPTEINVGTRDSYLYVYNNRNYSVEVSKEEKLISARIAGLQGFTENPEVGDFIEDFKNTLNTNNIARISELLTPDVEIYVGHEVYKINQRFLDSLSDPSTGIINQLLHAQNSVKAILNQYKGEISMEIRITEKGPSGYVYKFPDSKVLEEIFIIEQAGKWRIYEIRYRN